MVVSDTDEWVLLSEARPLRPSPGAQSPRHEIEQTRYNNTAPFLSLEILYANLPATVTVPTAAVDGKG